MNYGGMQDDRGGWQRHDWTDLDGNRHRSLSVPPKRRRRPRGMVLGVVRTVGKGLVITGAVVGLLVAFGVVR
jgi:hypothetical protein